jgi:hypothetical protein
VLSLGIDYEKFKKIFDDPNTFATGSSVLKAITAGEWEAGDIDIVTINPDFVGDRLEMMGFERLDDPKGNTRKYAVGGAVWCAQVPKNTYDGNSRINKEIEAVYKYILKGTSATSSTTAGCGGCVKEVKIDVIVPTCRGGDVYPMKRIASYIKSFDLDFCKNLYNEKLFQIINCQSVVSKTHIVGGAKGIYPSNFTRTNKYKARGFKILFDIKYTAPTGWTFWNPEMTPLEFESKFQRYLPLAHTTPQPQK